MDNTIEKRQKNKLIGFPYKITIGVIAVLILFISLLTYITIEREVLIMATYMNREKKVIAEMTARSMKCSNALETENFKSELVKIVEEYEDIYFCRIVQSDGTIFLSNKDEEKGKLINNFILMRFLDSKVIPHEYDGEQINVVLAPARRGYTVMLGYSLKSIERAVFTLILTNVIISVVIILIIVIISFVIAAKMVKPVRELIKGAEVIGEGNLSFRIHVKTNDEIGLLAESFNRMTETLQKTTVSKEYMDTVLNNMIDALFVTDKKGVIIMANKAAYELLGFSYPGLIGLSGNRIFHLSESPFHGESQREILSTGIIRNREGKLITSRGDFIPVLFSASVIRTPEKELDSIMCMAKDITEQKKSSIELKTMHRKLLHTAHQAGMGEIASGVLHNIGNILTSAGVSAETISYIIRRSRIPGLLQANEMLKDNEERIAEFLSGDPKGKLLPSYYIKVGNKLEMDYDILKDEISSLQEKMDMIKNVVDTQQEYAFSSLYMEKINLIAVIKDTLKIEGSNFKKYTITLKTEYPKNKDIIIKAQKTKVVDILVNCFKNAWEAMLHKNGERRLSISVVCTDKKTVLVNISDNGEGIPEEHLKKIFSFGFSTKEDGYGFGLHSCAIFMTEMGGKISAVSNGPGQGTTFTLEFPLLLNEPINNGSDH